MTTLITAVEEHHAQLEREMQEEVCMHNKLLNIDLSIWYFDISLSLSPLQQDRLARESMIAEQNRAYQASLDADREKVVT